VSSYEGLRRTSNERRVAPLLAGAFLPITCNPEVTSELVSDKRARVWECHWAHFAAAIHSGEWSPSSASDPQTCCGLANQVVNDKGRYREDRAIANSSYASSETETSKRMNANSLFSEASEERVS
jgi:hypothetical protein